MRGTRVGNNAYSLKRGVKYNSVVHVVNNARLDMIQLHDHNVNVIHTVCHSVIKYHCYSALYCTRLVHGVDTCMIS